MEKNKYNIKLYINNLNLPEQERYNDVVNYYVSGSYNQALNFAKKKVIEVLKETDYSLCEVYVKENGLYLYDSVPVVSFAVFKEYPREYEDISNEKDEETNFEDMLENELNGPELE